MGRDEQNPVQAQRDKNILSRYEVTNVGWIERATK